MVYLWGNSNPKWRQKKMQIEIVQPEIISTEDYQATSQENVFVHSDGSTIVVGLGQAVKVTP
jgi:hypothetical protein